MPRSEKLKASINRYKRIAIKPKPAHGEKAPESWWCGLSRDEFSQRAREESARMQPHSAIVGDRSSVTY